MTVSSSMAVTAQQPEWQQMTRVQAVIGSGSRSQSPCTAHFWCAVSQPEATRSSRVFSFFCLDFYRVQIAISSGWYQDQRTANSR